MLRLAGRTVLWLAVALSASAPIPAHAQSWRSITFERQVWEREPLEVELEYGAGTLSVGAADAPTLYRMELRYDESAFSPISDYDAESRRLRLGVRTAERTRRGVNVREGSTANIQLTREIPLDLDLKFGAGRADLRLGGMSLLGFSVSTGASETSITFESPNRIVAERVRIEAGAADLRVEGLGNARAERIDFQGGVGATILDFSGAWDRSARASVQMGVGSVTLRLPRSQGIRINRSSFLTSFNAPGLERQGNSYYSANWASAPHQLTININAAFGSIQIQWVD